MDVDPRMGLLFTSLATHPHPQDSSSNEKTL